MEWPQAVVNYNREMKNKLSYITVLASSLKAITPQVKSLILQQT